MSFLFKKVDKMCKHNLQMNCLDALTQKFEHYASDFISTWTDSNLNFILRGQLIFLPTYQNIWAYQHKLMRIFYYSLWFL